MTTPVQVPCPKCGRKKPYKSPDALYWRDTCEMMFDQSGDDGGDYSDRDPSARLERQERQQQSQKARRGR